MQKNADGGRSAIVLYSVASSEQLSSRPLLLPVQMLRFMRLLSFFMLAASMAVSGRPAAQTVSISVKDAPLEQVFSAIEKQTGYLVFGNARLLADTKPVTVTVSRMSLMSFLELLLRDQPVLSRIEDKTIVLSRKQISSGIPSYTYRLDQPPLRVKVLDSTGAPLPGASVLHLKKANPASGGGKRVSRATNTQGMVTVDVEEGDALIVTFVGMAPRTITITKDILQQESLSVTLTHAVTRLNDVEVTISTGYQKIKSEQITGSISTIYSKEYDSRINTTDFLTGLQNRIPGLLINNDVKFEGNNLFQIRGISTINGKKQPLVVVDGFPTELTLDMIDPYEIESVTVLRDAAAATVYGARSSNGVIVVERKKAKAGKLNVNFRSTAGFTPKENYSRYRWNEDASNTVINADKIVYENVSNLGWMLMTDPLYSDQYYNYGPAAQIMAHWRSSTNPISLQERDRQLAELGAYNNTKDYSRLFLRTASTQTYNLNMSGGSREVLYYLTANYIRSNASAIKNDNDRFQISGRTMMNFSKRFSLDLNTDFQKSNVHEGVVPDIHSIFPFERLQDENGNPQPVLFNSYANAYYAAYMESKGLKDDRYYPLRDINEINNNTVAFNNRITANFLYKIGYGFNMTFGGVYETNRRENTYFATANSSKVRQYVNRYTTFDAVNNRYTSRIPNGGMKQITSGASESYTLRAQLNYDKVIAQDHALNLILGSEIRDIVTKSNAESYYGYDDQTLIHQPVDYRALQDFVPTIARSNPELSYNNSFGLKFDQDRFVSLYSNLVYSYKRRYSLSGSIRVDQSNLFGTDPKYRYKPLWSAGAAWNIQNEDFMKDLHWVKVLKLRTAYGFNGNVAKNSLPQVIATAGLTNSINSSYSLPMLSLSSFANSGLKWEQTSNMNIGLDYEIFGKVTGSVDYYIKKSTDILDNNRIDPTKGGTSAVINRASIRNSGVEISLHADWKTTQKFNWNTGFVFSFNGSKVLEVFNSKITSSTSASNNYVSGTNANYLKGYAVGAIFAYHYAGVDTLGNPLIYDKNGKSKRFFSGVDNGREDVDYVGSAIPTHSIGMSNRVDVGRFYFYCMINYFGGPNVRVPVPYAKSVRPLEGSENYWVKRGDETKAGILPAIANVYYSYLSFTDRYIVKGAYLTLGDVTASYSFRPARTSRPNGVNFELRAQASNVYTVAFNRFNYSIATGSYEKPYLTPTYTAAFRVNF